MNEKIADLIVAAENNDADAQIELYGYIGEADVSEGNKKQILDWLRQSAKLGNEMSMEWLGICYTEGYLVDADEKTAFDWFVESAKAGNGIASCSLGESYKAGKIVAKDFAKAIDCFEGAIDRCGTNSDAERALGRDLCEVQDDDLEWWEAVAARSVRYPVVSFAIAEYFYWLKDQDLIRAIHFHKIAAEQGHGYSQYLLGKFYYTGEGVEKDPKLAFQWLEKAAQQEVVPAMYYLGKLYADDQSAVFDMGKAVDWWMRSRSLGGSESPGLVDFELSWCQALGVCFDQFERYEEERDCEYSALKFLLSANDNISTRESIVVDEDSWWYRYVKQGDAHALYWMGTCYEYVERLVPPKGGDRKVCMLDCFRKAAEMGNVFAQFSLACLLYHGPIRICDQDEGLRWYRLAAAQGYPDAIEKLEEIEATSKKS